MKKLRYDLYEAGGTPQQNADPNNLVVEGDINNGIIGSITSIKDFQGNSLVEGGSGGVDIDNSWFVSDLFVLLDGAIAVDIVIPDVSVLPESTASNVVIPEAARLIEKDDLYLVSRDPVLSISLEGDLYVRGNGPIYQVTVDGDYGGSLDFKFNCFVDRNFTTKNLTGSDAYIVFKNTQKIGKFVTIYLDNLPENTYSVLVVSDATVPDRFETRDALDDWIEANMDKFYIKLPSESKFAYKESVE